MNRSESPMPLVHFRSPPELWDAFKARAKAQGKTASAVLRDHIALYVREDAYSASAAHEKSRSAAN